MVGDIGHDMDRPARKHQRKLADQDRGRFHLAGAFAFAAQPARPGAQRGRLRSRSRESPACWTPCSTPASRRSKPRRLSWRNVIKQADGRDTRDCIDASHPRVWHPAADGAPVLDHADRPQNWLIGARRPANLATCRPAPDSICRHRRLGVRPPGVLGALARSTRCQRPAMPLGSAQLPWSGRCAASRLACARRRGCASPTAPGCAAARCIRALPPCWRARRAYAAPPAQPAGRQEGGPAKAELA